MVSLEADLSGQRRGPHGQQPVPSPPPSSALVLVLPPAWRAGRVCVFGRASSLPQKARESYRQMRLLCAALLAFWTCSDTLRVHDDCGVRYPPLRVPGPGIITTCPRRRVLWPALRPPSPARRAGSLLGRTGLIAVDAKQLPRRGRRGGKLLQVQGVGGFSDGSGWSQRGLSCRVEGYQGPARAHHEGSWAKGDMCAPGWRLAGSPGSTPSLCGLAGRVRKAQWWHRGLGQQDHQFPRRKCHLVWVGPAAAPKRELLMGRLELRLTFEGCVGIWPCGWFWWAGR